MFTACMGSGDRVELGSRVESKGILIMEEGRPRLCFWPVGAPAPGAVPRPLRIPPGYSLAPEPMHVNLNDDIAISYTITIEPCITCNTKK